MDKDDINYIVACSDSDNLVWEEGDWSYCGIDTVPPNPCHHCHFRGHHRIKPVNYERIKTDHLKLFQTYLDIRKEKQQKNLVNQKKQGHRKTHQAYQDESFLSIMNFGKHSSKIATLTKTMKDIFNKQLGREADIENLQKHLDVLAVNNDFQMLTIRFLRNLVH